MTSFFVTGGTLRHDAPSYVERQADRDLHAGLVAGEFCYVLTSRQMGKSSLMVRTANRLRADGTDVVVLDLTAIGQNVTPEQWYYGLMVRVGEQLGMDREMEEYWSANQQFGPCQRFFSSLRQIALSRKTPGTSNPEHGRRLVIFVDEIDVVRSVSFSTDEFFAAIRECYNRRSEDPEFNRLTFCLLGVATPSDLIAQAPLTPFNIGRRIELTDFGPNEAAVLGGGLGAENSGSSTTQKVLNRVLFWTGGHPYLTQRLCQALTGYNPIQTKSVDQSCEELFFAPRASERDDNLIFVRDRLMRTGGDRFALLTLYKNVIRGKRVPDDETNALISILRLSGVVRSSNAQLVERNRIYRRVFDFDWIEAHMPEAELRRQRAAFHRGVIRTAGYAAIVVAFMIAAVLFAVNQGNMARNALGESYFSRAKALRISGMAGQRHETLAALGQARGHNVEGPKLRDEVIACLALCDVKDVTSRLGGVRQSDISEINFERNVAATVNVDGAITLRNLKDASVVATLPATGVPVTRVRLSAYGPFLAAEYRRDAIEHTLIWDWEKGLKLFAIPHALHAEAIDFSSDNRKLAVAWTNGHVSVYPLPEGKPVRELNLRLRTGMPRVPQVLRFDPAGNSIAEACLEDDWNLQIWDLNTGALTKSLYHNAGVFDISWHPRGEVLATACNDNCGYLWDTNRTDDKPIRRLIGHEGGVVAVAFNHRGTHLATLGMDETLRLWNSATETHVRADLEGESFDHLQFGAGDEILLASRSRQVGTRAWELQGGEYMPLEIRLGVVDRLRNIDFSPDGTRLAAVTGERVTIWECSSGRELAVLNIPYMFTGCFSADSRHLLVSSEAGLMRCSLVTAPPGGSCQFGKLQPLEDPLDELGVMAMSMDRTTATVARQQRLLKIAVEPFDKPKITSNSVPVYYHRLVADPQGRWLAAMTSGSDRLHLWKQSEEGVSDQPVEIWSSEYFSFSPDGQWFATAWAGEFQFYKVGEWEKPAFSIPRQPPSRQHAPLAFAQQKGILAVAASRYTIELWRLHPESERRYEVIATLESPDRSPLEMLSFSPDDTQLAAATSKLVVQLWNLASIREHLAKMRLAGNWPRYPNTPTPNRQL